MHANCGLLSDAVVYLAGDGVYNLMGQDEASQAIQVGQVLAASCLRIGSWSAEKTWRPEESLLRERQPCPLIFTSVWWMI